ncbi:hypothetical protein NJ7G_1788 [Natrinema sp. J7-2]|uniref:Uncharacterized protein n=1 Tax=Natrinema gari JCM 14663 TaxID=1230459 RepID=L9ZE67_9EURY|nr:hypothetical protein NJ7G_1788 [Natrinema sp. J7-2]ELY83453.1 hypothetical protein C486_02288 [Natrinema gari JCM 14663]
MSDETGWYRIELSGGAWGHVYKHPPAGVIAAQEFLEITVDTNAFESWWQWTLL